MSGMITDHGMLTGSALAEELLLNREMAKETT